MHSKFLRRSLMGSAAFGMLTMGFGISGLAAQTASPRSEATGVQEIIVTAQKREESINDVGMSIAALSGDDLLKNGIATPESLADGVVGLSYSRLPSGPPVFSIRGIGFPEVITAGAPGVSTYIDEVPLPYSLMVIGAALDVQRVEVLKGPQGTLFGQNNTGGAVNFIANRPTADLASGLNISYGSHSQANANGYISGPLAPGLKARLAVGIDHMGDWQKSHTRDETRGEGTVLMGRLLVDWEPTETLTLQFNANGWTDKSDEPAAQLIGLSSPYSPLASTAARYPKVPPNARYADWNTGVPLGSVDPTTGAINKTLSRDNDFLQLSMRGDLDLGAATLTSISAWQKLNQKSLADVDGTDANNWNTGSGAEIEVFSQELRLSGQTGALSWLIGGNYMHENIYNYASVFSSLGFFPFRSTASIGNSHSETWAGFAHLEYALSDALSVLGGIRYTKVKIVNDSCTYDGGDGAYSGMVMGIAASKGVFINVPPGACITLDPDTYRPGMVHNVLDEDNLPFKVGLNWKVTPSSLIYANVSRGYKTGGFTLSGATYAQGFDPAKQESVLAYEAGFKLSLADNKVQINGAAFYYDYKAKQVRGRYNDDVVGTLNRLINIPESSVTGGEIQVTFAPSSNWRFSGGAAYTKSKISGIFLNLDALGAYRDLGGSMLPYTPEWQLIGDAEYNTPVSSGLDAFVGAHVKYQSDSYSGLGENAILKIDGYANLDLRAGVRSADGKWTVSVFADNVTDKYSWKAATLSGTDAITRTANLPRIVGIRLNLRN